MSSKKPDRWEARLQELKEFWEEYGHCEVPQRHPGGLGKWVSKQRYLGEDEIRRLDASRVQKLEELGFRWDKVERSSLWEVRYQELKEFKEAHGHCKVPQKHPGGLGMWVAGQRSKKARRRHDASQTQKLKELGLQYAEKRQTQKLGETAVQRKQVERPDQFGSDLQEQKSTDSSPLHPPDLPPLHLPDLRKNRAELMSDRWEARFRELEEFQEEHGHCNVPRKHLRLGKWVNNQRCAGKEKLQRLDASRVQKLDRLGFEWATARRRYPWEGWCQRLKEFKEEHGHCDVPQKYAGGLGNWVAQQRFKGGKRRLDAHQIQQLNELGFQWGKTMPDPCEAKVPQPKNSAISTDKAGEAVKAVKEEQGHCHTSELGDWTNGPCSSGKEESERCNAGQTQKAFAPSMDEAGEAAEKESSGCVFVPQKDPGGADLVMNQRSSPKLEGPGLRGSDQWEAKFRELGAFKGEHGHCNVPRKHPGGLGIWSKNQRAKKRIQRLDADRSERLEELGFQWEISKTMPDRWEARLRELQEFVLMYGHCHVPQRHPGGLGKWLTKQRYLGEEECRRLDPNRVQRLEELGFSWDKVR